MPKIRLRTDGLRRGTKTIQYKNDKSSELLNEFFLDGRKVIE
jgi:hypothetical protein